MSRPHRFQAVVLTLVLAAIAPAFGRAAEGTMAFTLSVPQPANHAYHVVFRCEGLPGPTLDFKMPAWTPGYYGLFDFAKNVQNFRAEDGEGRPLAWEMTSANGYKFNAAGLKATFNFQLSKKEPHGFIHNARYVAQLLVDSIRDLGGDVSLYTWR